MLSNENQVSLRNFFALAFTASRTTIPEAAWDTILTTVRTLQADLPAHDAPYGPEIMDVDLDLHADLSVVSGERVVALVEIKYSRRGFVAEFRIMADGRAVLGDF